ncbi:MAG: hypothetical protein U5J95_12505 [Balneolaceae bacterium]|nr:hypothetical protein [Balneolaceae bacterium]
MISPHSFCLLDNDANNDGDGRKGSDGLKSIGIPDEDFKDIGTGEWNIGDRYCVFGNDFKATMRASFTSYEELEERSQDELGSFKTYFGKNSYPKRLEVDVADEGWQKISEIVEKT